MSKENRIITLVWFTAFDRQHCEVFDQTNADTLEFYKNSIKVKTTNDAIFHDVYQFNGNDGKKLL